MHNFGTLINCIDGRVQQPALHWMKETYGFDYVDVITEPGPDKTLNMGAPEIIEHIKSKVHISISAHGSHLIAIAGHHDCAANPVSKESHIQQIRQAVQLIQAWGLPVEVIGIYVNEKWEVEKVV